MYIKSGSYTRELDEYISEFPKIFDCFKSKSVLITGAAGLIGTYIADLLVRYGKTDVIAVDRDAQRLNARFSDSSERLKAVCADVNDAAAVGKIFSRYKPAFVIHAASNTSPADYAGKPIDTICTNVIGSKNLLDACVGSGVERYMFCSSVEAYGAGTLDTPLFNESYSGYVDCNTLRAGYPSAKRACEALCNAYRNEYSLDFVTVRIGRIYGPTVIMNDTKAPTQFIKNALDGQDIVLKSPGTQEYSFGYVGDCASAMLFVLAKGETANAYNVADPKSRVLLRDFASAAASAVGRQTVFNFSQNLASAGYSKITRAVLDTSKLENLGWYSLHDCADGVKRTVDYLLINKSGAIGE